jgi:hypothetical protein
MALYTTAIFSTRCGAGAVFSRWSVEGGTDNASLSLHCINSGSTSVHVKLTSVFGLLAGRSQSREEPSWRRDRTPDEVRLQREREQEQKDLERTVRTIMVGGVLCGVDLVCPALFCLCFVVRGKAQKGQESGCFLVRSPLWCGAALQLLSWQRAVREQPASLPAILTCTTHAQIMNLSLRADERNVFEHFAVVGAINDIRIIRDKHTRKVGDRPDQFMWWRLACVGVGRALRVLVTQRVRAGVWRCSTLADKNVYHPPS